MGFAPIGIGEYAKLDMKSNVMRILWICANAFVIALTRAPAGARCHLRSASLGYPVRRS